VNVAEFTLKQLAAWGVKRVYGVIGDAILPLMDALARQQELQFVQVCQEAAGGFMASAEAKLTGGLAVCIGTSGPGLANLINGLGDAYADRVPLLALTGQVESYKVGTDVKQEINQQALLHGLAGYSALVAGPGAAPQVLVRALKMAVGEGKVAQVSVPKDIWSAPLDAHVHPPEPFLTAPPVAAPPVIAAAVTMLQAAKKPVILAGHGARPAARELLALAGAWGAGIIMALGAKGMLPGAHPLVLGGVGAGGSEAAHRALRECDLVLVVGSTWWPPTHMPAGVPVVQIDRCPANIGAKTAVAFGLPGDCREILPGLTPLPRCSDWEVSLRRWKAEWEAAQDAEAGDGAAGGPVPPARLIRTLESALPPEAIVTLDTGDHLLWFNRHFRGSGQQQVLFSGTWRTMGYGLPAASAAAMARPGAAVAALVGDGGLTMQLGELTVPARQNLNLTVVVARNGSLALEQFKAESEGLQPFGHTLNNPDFAAVARAFGWQAWRVENPQDLESALKQAVAHPGPALVDVNTVNNGSLHKK